MTLPYGWSQDYAILHLLKEVESMRKTIASLEEEIQRLDAQKANRAGRKSKPLSGDSGPPIAQGNARITSGDVTP